MHAARDMHNARDNFRSPTMDNSHYLKVVSPACALRSPIVIDENICRIFIIRLAAYQPVSIFTVAAFFDEYISAHHTFPFACVTETQQMSLKSNIIVMQASLRLFFFFFFFCER
jgi:hypothetical protein